MEKCVNREKNTEQCPCDYPCERKGMCCECVGYHRESGGMPACLRS